MGWGSGIWNPEKTYPDPTYQKVTGSGSGSATLIVGMSYSRVPYVVRREGEGQIEKYTFIESNRLFKFPRKKTVVPWNWNHFRIEFHLAQNEKVTSVDGHPTVVRDLSKTIFDGIAYLGLQYALYLYRVADPYLFLCGSGSSIFLVPFTHFIS